MKKVLCLVMVLLIAAASLSYGDDVKKRALSEELLISMDVQENMLQIMDMVKQMQIKQFNDMCVQEKLLSEKEQAMSEEFISSIMRIVDEELAWEKIKDDFINLYVSTFDEEDLQGILDFYKSSAGKKLVEKTPELMQKSMLITQSKMEIVMPKLKEHFDKIVEDFKKEMEKEEGLSESKGE